MKDLEIVPITRDLLKSIETPSAARHVHASEKSAFCEEVQRASIYILRARKKKKEGFISPEIFI